MHLKMIALDLDGTTLNSHHELTEKTILTLRRLSQKGLIVCIATGRCMDSSLMKYLRILDLPQKSIPAICYNGAYGYILEKDANGDYKQTVVFKNPVDEIPTKNLISFSLRLGLLIQYYNGETGEVLSVPLTEEHRALSARYAALVGKPQVVLRSYDEALAQSLSAKLLILTTQPDELIAQASAQFSADDFNVIRGSPDPFFVEFLRKDVSKGSALLALCEHLGLDASQQVAAFGDGDNDREMLQQAAVGVAMRNAKPLAQQAADVILQWTNDEDGVALQLLQMEEAGHFGF